MLRSYEQALLEKGWTQVQEGVEVKLCPGPDGQETFVLCRSAARREKERAMHERFERHIEEDLMKLAGRLDRARSRPDRSQVERQIGRILGRNSRAAGLFEIKVEEIPRGGKDGFLKLTWTKCPEWREWAERSEGCYLLRTNLTGWTAEALWTTYIQLTQAESAFRTQKGELHLRPIWFSFEEDLSPIWSETLAVWLKHGDLLSDHGYVVTSNEQLLRRFSPMPPVDDLGLDAVVRTATKSLFFSTEVNFFAETLGAMVGHGDVLSSRGRIVRTNQQLMANFHPVGPVVRDLGLDALVVRPFGEMWFSTEEGFVDANLGPISDGDLLSSLGYVVAGNLELLKEFGPIEDLANFGLDAVSVIVPWNTSDFDQDGDVDEADLDSLAQAAGGPGIPSPSPETGDFDGDGDIDQVDFGIWQRCSSGSDGLSDPECGD